jgi:hypothetical protein
LSGSSRLVGRDLVRHVWSRSGRLGYLGYSLVRKAEQLCNLQPGQKLEQRPACRPHTLLDRGKSLSTGIRLLDRVGSSMPKSGRTAFAKPWDPERR